MLEEDVDLQVLTVAGGHNRYTYLPTFIMHTVIMQKGLNQARQKGHVNTQ